MATGIRRIVRFSRVRVVVLPVLGASADRGNKIEVFDDLNKTIGNHDLKMGFMLLDNHDDWIQGPALLGGGGPSFSGKSQSTYFQLFCDPVNSPTSAGCMTSGGAAVNCTTNTPSPLPISCGGGVAAYLMDIPNTVRMPIEPPFAPSGSRHQWRNDI